MEDIVCSRCGAKYESNTARTICRRTIRKSANKKDLELCNTQLGPSSAKKKDPQPTAAYAV